MAINARALVTVEFTDGDIKEYPISAHKGITSKMVESLQERGSMILWNDEVSFAIPREQIKAWSIRDLTEEERARHEQGEIIGLPPSVLGAARAISEGA